MTHWPTVPVFFEHLIHVVEIVVAFVDVNKDFSFCQKHRLLEGGDSVGGAVSGAVAMANCLISARV